MLKEDIQIGDLLQTDLDLSRTPGLSPSARHVLVLSLDASEYTSHDGYVVVLDDGVAAPFGCMWLSPPRGQRRGSLWPG
jgi:hypothetical protein